jgi:metacaspase-1
MVPAPKGISLHIGVNRVNPAHYATWVGELFACEADAEYMQTLAKSQQYTTKVLLTAAATRAAVSKAIVDAAEATRPGDLFLLTYAGHGGQLPDQNGDETEDDADETWCLYDGELIDDVLYGLFARFKPGVRVLIVSDSCHSGSVSRDQYDRLAAEYAAQRRFDPLTGALVGPGFRGMPTDVARRTYAQNREEYDALLTAADPAARSKVSATVRLISACKDDQLAADGAFNGLFTTRLKRIWRSGQFAGDYKKFHADITATMPKIQTPVLSVYGADDPQYAAQRPFFIA